MTGTSRSGGNRRLSLDATEANGVPDCPKSFSNEQKAKWREVMCQLPGLLLRKIDVHQLGNLCRLLVLADVYGKAAASDMKAVRMLIQVVDRVHKLSASFGLTPADRRRMEMPLETEDEFDSWLKGAPTN